MLEPDEIDLHDQAVERELIREANERYRETTEQMTVAEFKRRYPDSRWEQERRLDWFVGFGLLTLLLAGWYFNRILAVWK